MSSGRLKVDQVDVKLRRVLSFLHGGENSQLRTAAHTPFPTEDDPKALEIPSRIREYAKTAATLIIHETESISSRRTSCSSPTTVLPDLLVIRKEQLDQEWEVNRSFLESFTNIGLYEGAVEMQRRGVEIRVQQQTLTTSRGQEWLRSEEHDTMQEQLADLLLQCDKKHTLQEAVAILQGQLGPLVANESGIVSIESSPETGPRKALRLHLKLGKAYKDGGHVDLAMKNLRIVFNAYDSEVPKDADKIQEVGDHLLALYEDLVHHNDDVPRIVRLSQLEAFRNEFGSALGRPLTECSEAIAWCQSRNITVSRSDNKYRFDIMDHDRESSPLHDAAENCHDEAVLQQVIQNSDTLENLNGDQETPLLAAVERSNSTAVALLLKGKASVEARDKEHQTVLHKSQKTPITKLLLEPRLRRSSAVTGSSLNTEPLRRVSTSSLATLATGVAHSIPDNELDINAQDVYKRTALYTACSLGRGKIVELLLMAGADPNIARPRGAERSPHSPLAAAIESKAKTYAGEAGQVRKLKIVDLLVRHGADPAAGREVLGNPRGPQGPIHRALNGLAGSPSRTSVSTNSNEEARDASPGGANDRQSSLSPTSTSPSAASTSLPPTPIRLLSLDLQPGLLNFPDFSNSRI